MDGILHVICPSDEKSLSKNSFQTSVSKNYLRIEKIAAHSKASPMGFLGDRTSVSLTGSPRSMRRHSCVSALRAPPARHPCIWATSTGKPRTCPPPLRAARWSAGLAASPWSSPACALQLLGTPLTPTWFALMFSLNTGVLEAEDVLSEQHTSSTAYDVMPKLNHIHLATSPHSLSAVAGQLCHLFVRLLEQGPSIFVCAVDRSVRTLIRSGERPLHSHVYFVLVVLVWHVVLLGPGCVRVSEQHQCVAHHVQDRREMLPIFLQRALCARTILAEIWVGSDKLLGGYSELTSKNHVTAGACRSLATRLGGTPS